MKQHVRGIVYACAAAAAALSLWYVKAAIPLHSLQNIRLTEIYGFIAMAGLYLALFPSPLYAVFPHCPGRAVYTRARRALGISTFCFALVHTYMGLFALLGGWAGLAFLSKRYFMDVVLSSIALVILLVLAATSTNWAQAKLGVGWRRLHRLVYVAAILTLLHVINVGSHFMKPTSPVYIACTLLVIILLALEGLRTMQSWRSARQNDTTAR
jgi:sulfoxide reductase heme-binding subunit YedZ